MNRIIGLDVLRCLAVVLVLWHHAPNGLGGGYVGVDLFFVLSGWLVSGLLFREYLDSGKISPGRFLLRRGFKIYPSFWVFIAFSLFWIPLAYGPGFRDWRNALAELLFVQNYTPGLWFHTWSIGVEEHFYIALALSVWALAKCRGLRFIPHLFAVVAVGCFVARALAPFPAHAYQNYWPTHLRIDSLMFGVLLRYWRDFGTLPHIRARWGLLGAALFVPAFTFNIDASNWLRIVGPALFYVGGGLMVITFGQMRGDAPLFIWLGKVGAASYNIYLWHFVALNIAQAVDKRLPGNWTPLLYYGGALAIGFAMTKLIELPALRLREKMNRKPKVHGGLLPIEASSTRSLSH